VSTFKRINQKSSPFFSVCIEIYNREETIEKVLTAVNKQSCRDFELIVVDNGSSDNSAKIVTKLLDSFRDVETQFIKEDRKSSEISGWNSPLRFAKGRYIAICEGDDYYRNDHLELAKNLLQEYPSAGIYVGGSKLEKFDTQVRLLMATDALMKLKMLEWCPPPSCIVFARSSKNQIPYYFDEDFVWAGEYSLYFEILKDGYDVIENNTENFVVRGFRFYLKSSFHMQDVLRIRHKKYFEYSKNEELKVDAVLFYKAWQLLVFNLVFGKIELELVRIIWKHFHLKSFSSIKLLQIILSALKNAISQFVKVKVLK
jgi:glycosyltransferase involved in cell wall biosynthesis